MTNFLHWRKMTWAFVLWSAALTAWLLIGGVGPIGVLLWFAGMSGFGLLWLATQPLFRQGRGLRGYFVRPGPGALARSQPPQGLLGHRARAWESRLHESVKQNECGRLRGSCIRRRERRGRPGWA